MIYTTQGLMTGADMADMADLHDWNAGEAEAQAELQAMEDRHADHAEKCPACQEEDSQRVTTARSAVAFDKARRALEEGVREALKDAGPLPWRVREALERGLKEARAALRSI